MVPIQDTNNELIQPLEEKQYPEVVRVLLADLIRDRGIEKRREDYFQLSLFLLQ